VGDLIEKPISGSSHQDADPAVQPSAPTPYHASEALIFDALGEVYDPELGIDIVSLGLVYGATLDQDGLLNIDITLTSPYCPLGSVIQTQAHAMCATLPGVKDVKVNIVWSPPWDPRVMASDEAKLELGIY